MDNAHPEEFWPKLFDPQDYLVSVLAWKDSSFE